MSKPRIAITLGDPAGIGPEIVRRAVNSLKVQRVCSPVVFGDSQSFKKYFKNVKNCELVESYRTKKIIKAGVPSKEGGEAALAALTLWRALPHLTNESVEYVELPKKIFFFTVRKQLCQA